VAYQHLLETHCVFSGLHWSCHAGIQLVQDALWHCGLCLLSPLIQLATPTQALLQGCCRELLLSQALMQAAQHD